MQGSNSDGVWNEQGVSLPILITPPWWRTNWFRVLCAAVFLALLWAAYQFRVRQLQREFNMRLERRVEERTRIARELHDTLLQSVQGVMFSFQAARNLLPERTDEAIRTLDGAIREGDEAIAEGRDAIQGLRANPALESNLEHLLTSRRKGTREIFQCGGRTAGIPGHCGRSAAALVAAPSGRGLPDRARDPAKRLSPRARQPHRGSKSRTTANSSGCGFAIMERASTARSSSKARARGTGDCRASASARNESGRG